MVLPDPIQIGTRIVARSSHNQSLPLARLLPLLSDILGCAGHRASLYDAEAEEPSPHGALALGLPSRVRHSCRDFLSVVCLCDCTCLKEAGAPEGSTEQLSGSTRTNKELSPLNACSALLCTPICGGSADILCLEQAGRGPDERRQMEIRPWREGDGVSTLGPAHPGRESSRP